MDFQLILLQQYQKPQLCVMKKKLTKGIQSLLTVILQGAKRALFFTLNAIILQSSSQLF
jgi:hypothetical protein